MTRLLLIITILTIIIVIIAVVNDCPASRTLNP